MTDCVEVEHTVRKWLFDQRQLIMLDGRTLSREIRLHTLEDVAVLFND